MSRFSGINLNFPWFFAHFRPVVCRWLSSLVLVCGSAQAVFFAEIQLCEYAFLKADLFAERPLSLVW
ncbi:TPA: hypothetical protein I7764_21900 [Vibrio vulnificus]|nr:hypothetical protein [Vibrio vulnificus]